MPLLSVTIPPLVDAPGHLARIAIGVRQWSDPAYMAEYIRVRPSFVPNLGVDILVALLAGLVGTVRAFWLVTLLIPPLMVAAIALVARAYNPRGAAAIGWALVFVWSSPLLWGFLNYWLATSLALAGFAGWRLLEARRGWREALFWIAVPTVFLAHAVAGCLMVLLIGGWEIGRAGARRILGTPGLWPAFIGGVRPLLLIMPLLAWWQSGQPVARPGIHWSLRTKVAEFASILKDQFVTLDIVSLALVLAVIWLGLRRGARLVHGAAWPVALIWLAFLILPFGTAGGAYLDMRVIPVALMVTLLLIDWSPAPPVLTRVVLVAGLALFAARLTVTTVAFTGHERSHRHAMAALDRVTPGTRVMAFVRRDCGAWRHPTRTHLPSLATLYRRAWVNSLWDVPGLHTTDIRYRPSPIYYHDPSQLVWVGGCAAGSRRTTDVDVPRSIADVSATLPRRGYDYLWLIGVDLPARPDPRFAELWRGGDAVLYRRVDARIRTGASAAPSASASPAPNSQPAITSLGQ